MAVVVPSPATSDVLLATSFTICAPMFSSASFSSISFATVTPSLVIVGDPNFLSRMTLRPLGPRVTFTALARLLTPRRMPCREESPYTICFAISVSPAALRFRLSAPCRLLFIFCSRCSAAVDDGQHFVLAHDEVLLAIELDFLARVLAEEDQIARLDIERDALAVVVHLAVAGGDDLALLRLLFGRVRDDDPADFLLAFFKAPNDEPIVQRSDIHHVPVHLSPGSGLRAIGVSKG